MNQFLQINYTNINLLSLLCVGNLGNKEIIRAATALGLLERVYFPPPRKRRPRAGFDISLPEIILEEMTQD